MSSPAQLALYALLFAVPVAAYVTFGTSKKPAPVKSQEDEEPKSIMQPPREDLDPPKDTPFTLAQLAEYDGSDASKPIYVSIKGLWLLASSEYDDNLS
jgi:membrane-associated progesterone receptor component